jgi:hypothetical protein
MVNTDQLERAPRAPGLVAVTRAYVVVAVGTVVALGVLAAVAPSLATQDAWGHAVIVAVFAVVLPLRVRAARRGSLSALRAVAIISAVLFLVNVVEAAVPDLFPTWMRIEMVAIAVLMATSVLLVVRARLADRPLADRHTGNRHTAVPAGR